MFSKLIKSEARKSILQLFTQNSRQKYYLRELASKINYSPGSLQRELNSLVESGLILSEKMGNLRFFFLNQKCPLLKELKLYLLQHAATESKMESSPTTQKAPRLMIKSKKGRPVLEQNISNNPLPSYPEKQLPKEEILETPAQPTIQSTTHSTIQISTQLPQEAPQKVTKPMTPYSHIEPPTFSKPVLHKPYLEKPRIEPFPSEPAYMNPAAFDEQTEPPVMGGTDIEIHIE